MKILVTGAAGFIGFHLIKNLLQFGHDIVGIDNINDYYDVNLKYGRLTELGIDKTDIDYGANILSSVFPSLSFIKMDLVDKNLLLSLFAAEKFDVVCNLAAQAGVRYSLINPQTYIDSNIQGFINILECARNHKIKHLVYASSSSVYGLNEQMPFSTNDKTDTPASLYAATKKSNELMAHTYSHLFGIPTTGLRFFTVYGPWGRPDMALFLFTKAIIENKPIEVFNMGNMRRDFTYIDDIVEGITRIIAKPYPTQELPSNDSSVPARVFNIGRGTPVGLMDFITEIEKNIGITAMKQFLPLQDGDLAETWADVSDLEREFDYRPSVNVEEGVKHFVNWYKKFYNCEYLQPQAAGDVVELKNLP